MCVGACGVVQAQPKCVLEHHSFFVVWLLNWLAYSLDLSPSLANLKENNMTKNTQSSIHWNGWGDWGNFPLPKVQQLLDFWTLPKVQQLPP